MTNLPVSWYAERTENELQKELLWIAHDIIISTLPRYKTSLKWKVPFYTYVKDLCYLSFFKNYIYVSFLQGHQLDDHRLLIKHETKMVAKYFIRSKEDLSKDEFSEILLSACALQESLYIR